MNIRTFTRRALLLGGGCLVVGWLLNRPSVLALLARPLVVPDAIQTSDAVVAVGRTADKGCMLDRTSTSTVAVADRLMREQHVPIVVFAGGSTTSRSCTAAALMARTAQENGVAADRIRTQPSSTTIVDDAARTDAVLRTIGAKRILLVADPLATRRLQNDFERLGYVVSRASVPVADADLRLLPVVTEYEKRVASVVASLLGTSSRPHRAFVSRPPVLQRTLRRADDSKSAAAIVLLGTSDVQQWRIGRIGDTPVINKGRGGERTADLLARFSRDVIAQHPAAVVIWGFENDIFDAPNRDYQRALETIQKNYVEMIRLADRAGIEPVFATEVTEARRFGFAAMVRRIVDPALGKTLYEDRLNREILDQNDWLREFCRINDILLLDFQPLLSDALQYRLPEFAAQDASHISAAGYDELERYSARVLTQHLRIRNSLSGRTS